MKNVRRVVQGLMIDKVIITKVARILSIMFLRKFRKPISIIDHPRDHPRPIAFHQTNFSDCTVTDKGPHHRCCYLEKYMYASKSILKGSHHRHVHRNIFAITWFQRKKTMHHWATTGNVCNFLLMGNCYHKRDIFFTWKTGRERRTAISTGCL